MTIRYNRTIFFVLLWLQVVTELAPCNANLLNDIVVERPQAQGTNDGASLDLNLTSRKTMTSSSSTRSIDDYDDSGARQRKVWEMIETMDSYKKAPIYSRDSVSNKPTDSSFHYLVLPSWWSHQNSGLQSLTMSKTKINNIMDKTADYYSDMSFGKLSLTYEVLNQNKIQSTKNIYEAQRLVKSYIDSKGYVKNVDYDGIIFLFWESSSALDWGGAKGQINGHFIWISYADLSYKVVRHEIGHNFGHDHHLRRHYSYRQTRPDLGYYADGLDMLSGGNDYDISDFGLPSKWFFNWIDDTSIIHMQPEGATDQCPSCLSSGTFTIKPFDMRGSTPSSSNDNFGIHIPITTVYDSKWKHNFVYSYWLSYRSGVDGIAQGLSVHLAWFELYDSMFGAYYDSMFYYSNQWNDIKLDAIVKVGKCFHVSPASYLKDRDLLAVNSVQPVVCVESLDEGSSLTVTVSFLNPHNPPPKQVEVDEHSLTCGSGAMTKRFDASKTHLVHVKGTGQNGQVTVKQCNPDVWSQSYLYDSYPYAHINYDSLSGYGAMKRLPAYKTCTLTSMHSLQYQSDYDETYVLIPSTKVADTPAGSITKVNISCSVSRCANNQYKLNGKCSQCPEDRPRSNTGSTSISNCFACPVGTSLTHPLATICTLSDDFSPIKASKGWRLWAPDYHTTSGNRWGVKLMEFYETMDCSGTPYNPRGNAINSNNFGTSPDLVFSDDSSVWTGKKDSDGAIWIGMLFFQEKSVQCVKLVCTNNSVREVRVQALVGNGNNWQNVWIEKNLDTTKDAELIISFERPPTPPTKSPTKSPTKEPSLLTTKAPTKVPTVALPISNPIKEPSRHPIESPTIMSSCDEDEEDIFVRTIKGNRAVLKTCRWLSEKDDVTLVDKLCKKNEGFGIYKPANEMCPVTCNICTCEDHETGKFLLKTIESANGAVKAQKRDCSWLRSKSSYKKSVVCARTESYRNIEPAMNVCRATCKTEGYCSS
mmetsp:Transcript_18375/g.22495  ORF Transcript_18375/g.22495 Transcript_18375/m.22495 type:complete len:983 (-) Transcript_18375:152-3100(-)